jgi:hypothetical protein
MTYSSTKQLTNRKLYEYLMAKRKYDNLMNHMLDLKGEIEDGLLELGLYPEYAKRLINSKQNCFDNIDSYNQAVKALIEAKLAVMTEPDQMDDIYDCSIKKEHKYN